MFAILLHEFDEAGLVQHLFVSMDINIAGTGLYDIYFKN